MIIVDDREPLEYQKLGDTVARLNCDAAVIVEDRIIRVERKTIPDLIKSLEDGRLNNQLAVVDELVIVDDKAQWLPRGVFESIYGDDKLRKVFNGLQEHHVVKMAENVGDYLDILRLTERKLKDGTYATLRIHARTDERYDSPEVGFIQGIPGIGPDLARQLVDYYHTPINVLINVSVWKDEIPGIGKRKVDTALRFLLGGGVMKKRTEVEEHDKDWEREYKETISSLMGIADASKAAGVKVNLKRRGKRGKGKNVSEVREEDGPG